MRATWLFFAVLTAGCGSFSGGGIAPDPASDDGGGASAAATSSDGGGPGRDGGTGNDGSSGVDGGAPPGSPKIVFVTERSYPARFSDAAVASAACETEARGVLGGSFTAFLYFSGGFPPIGKGPWKLPSGTPVADSTTKLVGGELTAPIDQTSSGAKITGVVWTGTSSDGTKSANCNDWETTASSELGLVGSTTAQDTKWMDDLAPVACSELAHLYCFQQ